MDIEPTTPNEELLKELHIRVLPKKKPPMSDREWEEHNIKMLHEFFENLRKQHTVEIRPRAARIFPQPHAQRVTELLVRLPTMGGAVLDP